MRVRTLSLPNALEWAWLFLALATLTFQDRDAEQALSGTVDATNFLRFCFDGIALTIVAFHLERVPRFRLSPISVFLAYVMVGVCSSLWSTSVVASLGKSMELMAAVLIVWITMARADAEARLQRLVNWTVVEVALLLSYIAIGAVLDPNEFFEPSRGLLPYLLMAPLVSSNSVSQLGAFLGLFCLARTLAQEKRRGKWGFGLCYLACLVFPVAAQGRTGMVSVVVGSALLFARRYPFASILAIPATAALASLLLGDTLLKLFVRGENDAELYSLTGRTDMWAAGWQAFIAQPFIGSGFGVGSRTLFLHHGVPGFDMMNSTLHNGPLEVVLGVGLVGFAIWAGAVSWGWRLAAAAYLRGDHLPTLIGMVVATTATFLSIGLGGWLNFTNQYFLAAVAFLWVRSRRSVATAAWLRTGEATAR